eukprot:23270-Eustigmatos_ZCMA.PRE.1
MRISDKARPSAKTSRPVVVMSSLFMEETTVADRIKDGLLIRYLSEVWRRALMMLMHKWHLGY